MMMAVRESHCDPSKSDLLVLIRLVFNEKVLSFQMLSKSS